MGACHVYKEITGALDADGDAEVALSRLTSPQDALAAAVHACLLQNPNVKFVDATFSSSDSRAGDGTGSSTRRSSQLQAAGGVDSHLLPENWNAASPNFYAFIYRLQGGAESAEQDTGSSLSLSGRRKSGGRSPSLSKEAGSGASNGSSVVDLTITRLGPANLLVSALNNSTGRQSSCKLELRDYVNDNVFTRPDGSEDLQDVYRSDGKIEQLAEVLNSSIISRISRLGSEDPGEITSGGSSARQGSDVRHKSTVDSQMLQSSPIMAGAEDTHQDSNGSENNSSDDDRPHRHHHHHRDESSDEDILEPLAEARVEASPPLRPPALQSPIEQARTIPQGMEGPPGFEDEYEMRPNNRRRPSRHEMPEPGAPNPYVPIGSDDLYPPGIGRNPPLRPFGPTVGGGGNEHQGMHPTFDHPLFQGRRSSRNPDRPDDMSAPPGARWDPTGPSGNFGPNRFI